MPTEVQKFDSNSVSDIFFRCYYTGSMQLAQSGPCCMEIFIHNHFLNGKKLFLTLLYKHSLESLSLLATWHTAISHEKPYLKKIKKNKKNQWPPEENMKTYLYIFIVKFLEMPPFSITAIFQLLSLVTGFQFSFIVTSEAGAQSQCQQDEKSRPCTGKVPTALPASQPPRMGVKTGQPPNASVVNQRSKHTELWGRRKP